MSEDTSPDVSPDASPDALVGIIIHIITIANERIIYSFTLKSNSSPSDLSLALFPIYPTPDHLTQPLNPQEQ